MDIDFACSEKGHHQCPGIELPLGSDVPEPRPESNCRSKPREDQRRGTGHGFGLEIHEYPSITYKSRVKIENAMAVTIEPGIYIPGKGGVRIEDDVLPDRDNPIALTQAKKEIY